MIKKVKARLRGLTNTNKKSIMFDDSRLLLLGVWKQFHTFKKIITRVLSNFRVFFEQRPMGRRRTVMKMINKNRGRFWVQDPNLLIRALATILVASALVACGGGGGGDTTPTPTTVTVTCPDDSKQTASTLDLATSACPAPTLVSITPANNATGVAPESIATTGIVIATSSALTTPASGDVTLTAGGVTVPATVAMVGTKGFKIVPSAKLLYAQAYTVLANVKDRLGKNLSVSGTFTTASVSCTAPLVPDSAGTSCVPPTCTAPAVWSGTSCGVPSAPVCTAPAVWTASLNACVSPISVKMSNPKTLPLENGLRPVINGPVWKASIQDGSIQFFDTGLVMTGYRTDTLVMAFFIVPDNGSVCSSYLFKANGSGIYPSQGTYSCKTGGIDWVVGTADGHIMHVPSTGECYKNTWNQSIQNFEEKVTACPF